MDYHLTIAAIGRRAETRAPHRPLVGLDAEGDVRRTTWSALLRRARRLAAALQELGVRPGDRVATLCWNQLEHLEAYFGVPLAGGVLHTLNVRAGASDLAYMIRDAESRVLIVDRSLLAVLGEVREAVDLEQVIVVGPGGAPTDLEYEALLAGADLGAFDAPEIDERDACALCYTTGTTGRPKGVLASHRALALQSLVLMAADLNGIREADVIMVVVPMFHANAWGHPYAAALAGASLVLPHQDLSPRALLRLIAAERVTVTGGISTVWADVLRELDARPGEHDVSSIRVLRFGGARAPVDILRAFEERHGVPVVHSFGMTELSPMGGMATLAPELRDAPAEQQWRHRAKQGRPIPFLEARARGERGFVPWDGETPGELELRGPSVAAGYYGGVGSEALTDDGWLRTGDIVTIDEHGAIEITDRVKDLIKSGGEWISSVALEDAICRHPAVREAAVIAIPDARWQERPLAIVVADPAAGVTGEALREHLAVLVPRWWLPARFEFVDALPRTGVGKVSKPQLRARFASGA